MEGFYRQKGEKSRLFSGLGTLLMGDGRGFIRDYLTSASQVIPGWLVKGYIHRKAETKISLGMNSQFGDRFSTSDSILSPLSLL